MNVKTPKKSYRQEVQIIAGTHRHRKIHFTEADDLRPTGARIRETLFNWLQPAVIDARCLDLFAGSGILGIEALSRGAKTVTFVEKNRQVFKQLKANLTRLNMTQAHLINQDFKQALTGQYDIIFLDPPYKMGLLPTLLEQIKVLSPRYVFIEDKQDVKQWLKPETGYQIHKHKKAGDIYYGLLIPYQA